RHDSLPGRGTGPVRFGDPGGRVPPAAGAAGERLTAGVVNTPGRACLAGTNEVLAAHYRLPPRRGTSVVVAMRTAPCTIVGCNPHLPPRRPRSGDDRRPAETCHSPQSRCEGVALPGLVQPVPHRLGACGH